MLHTMLTEKPVEQTHRDKAVGKRPAAPSFENSEVVYKKMKAEEDLKSEDMQPFKAVEVAKKEVAAAVAESAVKKAKEWENRAEKAEKAMGRKNAELSRDIEVAKKDLCKVTNNYFTMMFKNAELYRDGEVAKEDLAAAKVATRSALKKAEDSYKRAVKAEKSLEDWKKAFKDSSKKAEDWSKRAVKAEKALEDWKKALEDWKKAFKDSSKRAEKAEKALIDVIKIALKNYSRSGIQNAVARGMR